MCRRNKLWAAALIAFGIGLLIGAQIGSGFFPGCFALGIIAAGVLFFQK